MKKLYKDKYNIYTKDFFDIDIIQWWKWWYFGTPSGVPFTALPRALYKDKQSIKRLCRYVIKNEIGLKTRDDISQITTQQMRDYKISFDGVKEIKASPYNLLVFCYPEYNYRQFELKHMPNDYWKDEDNWIEAIDFTLNENNLTLEDVISGNSSDVMILKFGALITTYFGSIPDLWIWYYKGKGITLNYWDFSIRPQGYWNSKDNIINEVRNYCEYICSPSILHCINNKDSESLVLWISEFFTRERLNTHSIANINNYNESFDLLTLAYPQIISDKLLFQWDFTGCKKWDDKEYRKRSLRELVLYRLQVKNKYNEIPKALTRSNLKAMGYSKFTSIKDKYYLQSTNFYEWACESFPEHKNMWTSDDFGGVFTAYDGAKCNSNEERMVYEFIKQNLTKRIISLGYNRSGKYTYKLSEGSVDNMYCPDFVVEGYDKPIIIEYFGMYNYSNQADFAIKYNEKTHRKNDFFRSNNKIYYIDIYPNDLRKNYEGVSMKFKSLLEEVVAI